MNTKTRFLDMMQDISLNTLEIWKSEFHFTFRIFSGKDFTEFVFDKEVAFEIIKILNKEIGDENES